MPISAKVPVSAILQAEDHAYLCGVLDTLKSAKTPKEKLLEEVARVANGKVLYCNLQDFLDNLENAD